MTTRTVQDVRDHYDGLAFGSFCYSDRRASFYPLVDEFFSRIGSSDRVCDVGCGAGFWLDEFVRRGLHEDQILGIDLAPAHVAQACARGHDARCGDVMNLDLPDGAVDFTFCSGVIHHTPDPRRALAELARITRPGGWIYLVVYNAWHPYFWMVHKATAPLRALHWRGWTRTTRAAYAAWKIVVQPISGIALGRRLDEQTCHALFMDQVLTPYAWLYTRGKVRTEAARAGLEVVKVAHALRGLMIVAILQVRAHR